MFKADEYIDLDEWEFEYQQHDSQPILMVDFWARAALSEFPKAFAKFYIKIPSVEHLHTDLNKQYIKKARLREIIQKISLATNKQIEKLIKETMVATYAFGQAKDKIIKERYSANDRSKLLKLWKEFDQAFCAFVPWFYIPWYLTSRNIVSDKLKERLFKYKDKIEKITDFNNALMIMMYSEKQVAFQRERTALYDLVKCAQKIAEKNKTFASDIKYNKLAENYLKDFSWMKTYILLPKELLGQEELSKTVETALQGTFIEEYELQQKTLRKNKSLEKRIIAIVSKQKNITYYSQQAKELSYIYNYSVDLSLRYCAELIPFFKTIAKSIGVNYKDWVLFTGKEIEKMISGRLSFKAINIKERKEGFVLISNKKGQKFIFGKEGKKLAEYIDKKISIAPKNVAELRGQCACPGVVKGSVRIALTPKDSFLLLDGEILVCPMTNPEYLPAMKRAGAFVTNEGGLLSHAAIISREFGKPCVLGTKNGTQILKTGDFVEVNADKGIVKILNKKQI